MGNFRSDSRGGGFRGSSGGRGGFGGGRSSGFSGGGRGGGRGGFRDRDSGGFQRPRPEMHPATCSKCGEQCEVPFRPTGEKPVFCSNCFEKEGNSSSGSRSGSRGNFDSRNRNTNTSPQSGISSEQFKQLNEKLDKILGILETIEFEVDEEGEEDEEAESDSTE